MADPDAAARDAAPDLDVVGVGNAIVDVLAHADDAFLRAHGVPKGGMELIDETRAASIYRDMPPGVEISGGSAANTIACLASLGGRGGFIGKVGADALGDIFRHDLQSLGVEFETAPLNGGPGTGRCLVNVTPDAQRSMSTFLGAAGYVAPEDVDEALIGRAAITFFEGYLFEQPAARDAFVKASATAAAAGRKTAFTLSDAGVVERQFDAIAAFVRDHVDILLANENEAAVLFGTRDAAAIEAKARATGALVAVTRSARGSVLIPPDGPVTPIEAVPPTELVDSTGAGDAYAAGLLFGIARGRSLEASGRLGAIAASEVISHFGARPDTPLSELAAEADLL